MLKQLMLTKKIEGLRNTLNEYLEEEQKLVTRSVELEAAIEETAVISGVFLEKSIPYLSK